MKNFQDKDQPVAELKDWRHPRDVDPEAYAEMLAALKPFDDQLKAIEAEIDAWKTKSQQNVLNGRCPKCQIAFRQEISYPVCSNNVCLAWPCQYCLAESFDGYHFCPCNAEIQKLHVKWDEVFTKKSEVSSQNYQEWLKTKAIYLKPPQ